MNAEESFWSGLSKIQSGVGSCKDSNSVCPSIFLSAAERSLKYIYVEFRFLEDSGNSDEHFSFSSRFLVSFIF